MDLQARTVRNVGARVYDGVIFLKEAPKEFLETPIGRTEGCGGAMIDGLLANGSFCRSEDAESVVTVIGVLE